MEYLPHGDLAQYIQNRPAEASTNARSLTIQLLRGLDILHKRNICHRDLKPPNVLLVSLDPIRVKITDFGISKQMAGTQLRTLCGTSGYIAPEITGFVPRSCGDYTGAVDMWALGTILHEMLVGVIPFAQEEGAEEDDDEEEEDGDEEEMVESESAVRVMQVDIHMLNNYCSGLTPFPEELLAEKGVGRETREVVKGLLVPQPKWRWGVERVLASSWLRGGESSG
ncbi:kinase-like domain-containing protein [Morchella snyderi]|nr:kinase-like domain-containing protein [Morchella snyderi]